MATIKSYTTVEQSRKLAEILPLESADGFWEYHDKWYSEGDEWEGYEYYPRAEPYLEYTRKENEWKEDKSSVPCWSLAALLEQLPYELCDDDGNSSYLQINKEDDVYQLVYADPYGNFESIETDRHEHFVDACVAMIESLHELNLL